MKKRFQPILPIAIALAISATPLAAEEMLEIQVAKTATCGCCTAWIEHLKESGFEVSAYDVSHEQLNNIKAGLNLDPTLTSCHTAIIGDYFIEGHVPASDIRQLIADEPDAQGLTVPGMPIGSPGMEMGEQRDPFDTLLVREGNTTTVFNSHNQ